MHVYFQQDDDYDFTGLMGDDQDFFDDDDFGLSGKPPPPYPGAGEQARMKDAGGKHLLGGEGGRVHMRLCWGGGFMCLCQGGACLCVRVW